MQFFLKYVWGLYPAWHDICPFDVFQLIRFYRLIVLFHFSGHDTKPFRWCPRQTARDPSLAAGSDVVVRPSGQATKPPPGCMPVHGSITFFLDETFFKIIWSMFMMVYLWVNLLDQPFVIYCSWSVKTVFLFVTGIKKMPAFSAGKSFISNDVYYYSITKPKLLFNRLVVVKIAIHNDLLTCISKRF